MKKVKLVYLASTNIGKKVLSIAEFLKKYDGREMSDCEWQSLFDELYNYCNELNVIYHQSASYVVEKKASDKILVIAYLRNSKRTIALIKRESCDNTILVTRSKQKLIHITAEMMVEDCVNAFYKVLNEKKCAIIEAMRIACHSEAPRFYFTYEVARRHVSRIERGLPLDITNKNKIEAIKEIHRRWKALGTTSYIPLFEILNKPAPKFYMSDEHFIKCIYIKLRKNETHKICSHF